MFENYFHQKPVGFTPPDGTGSANSLRSGADGRVSVTVTAPVMLAHDHAILLVVGDTGRRFAASRGEISVTAQHKLFARPQG